MSRKTDEHVSTPRVDKHVLREWLKQKGAIDQTDTTLSREELLERVKDLHQTEHAQQESNGHAKGKRWVLLH